MKKYIVKYKDSEKVFGEYNSRKEASDILMEYIYYFNDCSDGDYISPFDFVLEEVECKEVNEVITDFDGARELLGIRSNFDITVSQKRFSKSVVPIKGVARLVNEINPKHLDALIALNELFTIAEAWNKEDGFVPDFNNHAQKKWVPTFEYKDDYTGLDFWAYTFFSSSAPYVVGFRLCFKTKERAEQFGKQFIELYNKAFLSNK